MVACHYIEPSTFCRERTMTEGIQVTVGVSDTDIVGSTNRALQATVDYVAGLGGGTVEIGPGEYWLEDSLHLRSHVTVRGHGEATVLRKCDGGESRLTLDGDYGEEQIRVADPALFKVGMGVAVTDDSAGGFHTAVRTILAADGDTFQLNGPLLADCMVNRNAIAKNVFPVISGYYIQDARVENLTVDGRNAIDLRQLRVSNGVCYLRIRSTVETTDKAGLLVESVEATSKM